MASLYGEPYGVNYTPATPLPAHEREGIRSYFADDVVRAVDVSVAVAPIRRAVQPPLHPPATEGRRGPGRIVDRQRVAVQEAGLAGVALLGDADLDADCGFPDKAPKQTSVVGGFHSGDLVRAQVPGSSKKAGSYVGRIAVRATGPCNIQTSAGTIQGIHYRHCRPLHRADGYTYAKGARAFLPTP